MFLWPCIMNWPYKTTNVMHWTLFIRQILLISSTCFEYQVLIFRILKMSTWYSKHVEESNNIWRINNVQCITLVVLYGQFMMHGQRNIKLCDAKQVYHYNLLKMSTWYSKHVEESNNIWRINNVQCITLVVLYGPVRTVEVYLHLFLT